MVIGLVEGDSKLQKQQEQQFINEDQLLKKVLLKS
jgi:hypothetical protein